MALKTTNSLMKQINRKSRQFTNRNNNLINYNNGGVYPVYFKTNGSCVKFCIRKTNSNFLTRYNKQISEIKLKKTNLHSIFAKCALENYHIINCKIIEILNSQKNIFVTSNLE